VEAGAYLYRAEDPTSLAAVIDRLLANAGAFAEIRGAAYELGQQRFNWEFEKYKLLHVVDSCFGEAVRGVNPGNE